MIPSHKYDNEKRVMRKMLLHHRVAPLPRHNRIICTSLMRIVRMYNKRKVASVWPLPGEVDLRILCQSLDREGYEVLLPETPQKGNPLLFRHWERGAKMRLGRFGTLFPRGRYDKPDMILVPLVAFDCTGGRLGYGGGYYDRTLANYPNVPAVGYALSSQEVEEVPMDQYDHKLDIIVTEKGVRRLSREGKTAR